jgi:hypothetical protein
MFSVIHEIENVSDTLYVREIIDSLGTFFTNSPRSVGIVQVSIMNSASTLAAFAEYPKTLPPDRREVVRPVLEALRKTKPNFAERCDALLADP